MGTIISRFAEKSTEKSSDKTTCISITAETYKCIDISAFVPECITITSNVPTSEFYEEPYDRDDGEIPDAPILEIILINNEAPVLNVNLDEEGTIYVTDFDVVYIKITNWDAEVEYVNLFSNEDGNDAVVYLDEAEERIVWALDDWAMDGVQMWFYAEAKASDELISPQSSVTVTQMKQTDQPNLSSWVFQVENTILNIEILDYDATYTYSEPIVTGGTAVRTDNIIAWTLPDVTANTYHEISITATAPLMYESLAGVSGGSVLYNYCVPILTGGLIYKYTYINVYFEGWGKPDLENFVVYPAWYYNPRRVELLVYNTQNVKQRCDVIVSLGTYSTDPCSIKILNPGLFNATTAVPCIPLVSIDEIIQGSLTGNYNLENRLVVTIHSDGSYSWV